MVDDRYTTCNVERIVLGQRTQFKLDIVKLKTCIDGIEYISSREFDTTVHAVVDLQKALPSNIQIICCQNCRHGNFCPYGNKDNEILCLKGYMPKDKLDVALIMDNDYDTLPKYELLHWCEAYQRVNEAYYTYNAWDYYFSEK